MIADDPEAIEFHTQRNPPPEQVDPFSSPLPGQGA